MDDPRALVRSVSFTVAGYPIYLARTLMQLGYEPVPPSPTGRLPNFYNYLKVIRQERGYLSLYTGLRFILPCVVVKQCTYNAMSAAIGHIEDVNDADISKVIAACFRESFLKINTAIITYPITTISIGYIASVFFESDEPFDYSISVLYKGIVPKLIVDVILVWVEIISCRLSAQLIKDDKTAQAVVSRIPPFLAHALLYPFNVVSTVMADNGRTKLNPKFDDWNHCWNYLREVNGLKRGSSIIWRKVPKVSLTGYKNLASSF